MEVSRTPSFSTLLASILVGWALKAFWLRTPMPNLACCKRSLDITDWISKLKHVETESIGAYWCQGLALQSLDVPHHKISSSLGSKTQKNQYCNVLPCIANTSLYHDIRTVYALHWLIDYLTNWPSVYLTITVGKQIVQEELAHDVVYEDDMEMPNILDS